MQLQEETPTKDIPTPLLHGKRAAAIVFSYFPSDPPARPGRADVGRSQFGSSSASAGTWPCSPGRSRRCRTSGRGTSRRRTRSWVDAWLRRRGTGRRRTSEPALRACASLLPLEWFPAPKAGACGYARSRARRTGPSSRRERRRSIRRFPVLGATWRTRR